MCYTPYTVRKKDKSQGTIDVPCGKCPKCVKRRASAWSFRLYQQDKVAENSLFITLTYETQNLPRSKNGFPTIRKRDVQLFYKRLRKNHSIYRRDRRILRTENRRRVGRNIKYFTVGEYGGKFKRPHYHAIVFNCKEELIQKSWGLGSVHIGQVTPASIGYCMKYMDKRSWKVRHERDDRTLPFAIMSKKLGINYLTKHMVNYHKQDVVNRAYCTTLDGKKLTMPRYYKDKIYDCEERMELKLHGRYLNRKKEAALEKRFGKNHLAKDKLTCIRAAFTRMEYRAKQVA